MSYRIVANTTLNRRHWHSNGFRFETKEEAEAYGETLKASWFGTREVRVLESDDPVDAIWHDGELLNTAARPRQ
jgi:hypothetical protein